MFYDNLTGAEIVAVQLEPVAEGQRPAYANHKEQFIGRQFYMTGVPAFPAHFEGLAMATRTVDILTASPGIGFENFRKLKGSTVALRYMIADGSVEVR